jgi:hypothetical protein
MTAIFSRPQREQPPDSAINFPSTASKIAKQKSTVIEFNNKHSNKQQKTLFNWKQNRAMNLTEFFQLDETLNWTFCAINQTAN